ncbi:MAG: NUDIX hydrolase [Erysipelotrichia bacterium]|nr:NUDIX hydrolase [Erysipelotrichia bacterium]NCC53902.1 NUDIX hydrolase [Erysipelotrichia bacterium]
MQKKISSKKVYEGVIFDMTRDVIEIESGKQFLRDVIHHDGGVAVLVVRNAKILFVKQYRYAIAMETLELPAGKLEKGEDPMECGIRELEEESGFGCSELNLICEMYSTPGFCTEKIYIYEAMNLRKIDQPKAMGEDEDIHICWIPIEEAYEMIHQGLIKDAKTILAIQYAYINYRI